MQVFIHRPRLWVVWFKAIGFIRFLLQGVGLIFRTRVSFCFGSACNLPFPVIISVVLNFPFCAHPRASLPLGIHH